LELSQKEKQYCININKEAQCMRVENTWSCFVRISPFCCFPEYLPKVIVDGELDGLVDSLGCLTLLLSKDTWLRHEEDGLGSSLSLEHRLSIKPFLLLTVAQTIQHVLQFLFVRWFLIGWVASSKLLDHHKSGPKLEYGAIKGRMVMFRITNVRCR
jgi:hypothetical protein